MAYKLPSSRQKSLGEEPAGELEALVGDENYTPKNIISLARSFLGSIDLDPFSCAIANEQVAAKRFFDIQSDGLQQDWSAYSQKWVNPPYSRNKIREAISKTLQHANQGETLLLVNSSPSAKWFHSCMEKCAAYLHPSRRINFDSPYRNTIGNRYDQALFYFGDRVDDFVLHFDQLGMAVIPAKKIKAGQNPAAQMELLKTTACELSEDLDLALFTISVLRSSDREKLIAGQEETIRIYLEKIEQLESDYDRLYDFVAGLHGSDQAMALISSHVNSKKNPECPYCGSHISQDLQKFGLRKCAKCQCNFSGDKSAKAFFDF
jgi:hypothetical protein